MDHGVDPGLTHHLGDDRIADVGPDELGSRDPGIGGDHVDPDDGVD